MEIGVRRLHNSYRVAGSPDESGLVRARLDRIAAADLPREFEAALAAAMRDDPTVYVVRRVQPTTWLADTTAGDVRVARRWGQSMARAVLAVLAAGRPEDVVCFADETAYVAQFVDDLLRDAAWERWYYFPLARWRGAGRGQTLAAVLQAHAAQLPALAARLYRAGSLEQLLAALEDAPRPAFPPWGEAMALAAPADARPLFAAALRLVGQLGLWRGEPPGLALVDDYLAAHELSVDWRDPHSLAMAVAAMVHFLAARGYLRAPDEGQWDAAGLVRRPALDELDWLDRDALGRALEEIIRESRPVAPEPTALAQRLFAAAIRLIERLGRWSGARPGPEALAAFLAEHEVIDEGDKRTLAMAVAEMVRFLAARGLARIPARDGATAADALSLALAELDWLDRDALGRALEEIIREDHPVAPEPTATARRLFAAAIRLIERLGRWSGTRPGPEALAAFLAEQGVIDEGDARALATTVAAMVRFLAARGLARFPARDGATAVDVLSLALADPGWPEGRRLDEATLRRGLLPLLAGEGAPAAAPPPLPARAPVGPSPSAPSPRLRSLLEDLLAALRRARAGERPPLRLDAGQAASPANVLRLLAALVDYAPRWADDELVYGALRRLLAQWSGRPSAATPAAAGGPERGASPGQMAPPRGNELEAALLAELDATAGGDSFTGAAGEALTSPYLGVALLWRAAQDAHLPALFADGEEGAGAPFAALLLALALRWAGAGGDAPEDEVIDPALCLLCGREAAELPTWEALRAALRPAGFGATWQAQWLRLLVGLRLLDPQRLHLYYLPPEEGDALVAGDAGGLLWPLGMSLADTAATSAAVAGWWALWQGLEAAPVVIADPAAAAFLPDGVAYHVAAAAETPLAEAHAASRAQLLAALAALEAGRTGRPAVDLPLALVAVAVLRLWARWLRGFSEASVPYLLNNLVRRRGRLLLDESVWLAQLARRPLDMVLEMAGYVEPLERVSWLDGRRLDFRLVDV
jgi:hypothetical protein